MVITSKIYLTKEMLHLGVFNNLQGLSSGCNSALFYQQSFGLFSAFG